ncbi:hypothetical protein EDB86DRAFT_2068907 [Lactarius hatsudake]|nr:hypothetical protein EDB86DRAFT_2068907 [Lactarius hatsudake]
MHNPIHAAKLKVQTNLRRCMWPGHHSPSCLDSITAGWSFVANHSREIRSHCDRLHVPTPRANGSQADGEPAAQANGVPAVQVDGEPVPEGEGAAANVEEEEEEEDTVPDPPNPFDFVPDIIIPTELEGALSTRCGGNIDSALHGAAAGAHSENML